MSIIDNHKCKGDQADGAPKKDSRLTFMELQQELGIMFGDDPLQEVLRCLCSDTSDTNEQHAQPDEFSSQRPISCEDSDHNTYNDEISMNQVDEGFDLDIDAFCLDNVDFDVTQNRSAGEQLLSNTFDEPQIQGKQVNTVSCEWYSCASPCYL